MVGILTVQAQTTALSWDFRDGSNHGWYPFIENYTADSLMPAGFISTFGPLPTLTIGSNPNVNITNTTFNTGYNLMFNNSDGGASMGLIKRLWGLLPNTSYNLNFTLLFASNVGVNCTATGDIGSPGEDVILKVGAIGVEPELGLDGNVWRWRNFVDGPFGQESNNAMIAGLFGTPASNSCSSLNTTFFLESRNVSSNRTMNGNITANPTFNFTTNNDGELWVLVETQSIFQSVTSIWWVGIDLILDVISTGTGGCPICPACNCTAAPVVNIFFNGVNFTISPNSSSV